MEEVDEIVELMFLQELSELITENCKSGDVTPEQSLELDLLKNKTVKLFKEIIKQNK